MASIAFRQFRREEHNRCRSQQGSVSDLQSLLSHRVIKPFVRLTANRVTAIPVLIKRIHSPGKPGSIPVHPACAPHAGSSYCIESWNCHMKELASRPHTHWHQCDFGRICAFVPVVHENKCVAAIQLACYLSIPEIEFESCLDLMDTLVEGFVSRNASLLARLLTDVTAEQTSEVVLETPSRSVPRPSHPQVIRALEHIDQNLNDSDLSVCSIARGLGMDPSYLGNIFSSQTGRRMSRHISDQRVERAKTLLTTTNHQVKRIAHETGYANPNWFTRVFRIYTGLTPNQYRRQASAQMCSSS